MINFRRAICVMVLMFGALVTTEASALNHILNVRHWVAPDHTRIVIDTSEVPEYTLEKSGEYIRIDFKNTAFPGDMAQRVVFNKPGVQVISVTGLSEERVRVEISLAEHKDTNVFKLPKMEEKPDRVVIDIELSVPEKKETEPQEPVQARRKTRVVVIDPGHGGEDPGAVGPRGTREKDVVLRISRILRDKLNKREGYRAFLTRDGDYYVSFKRRLKIAREYEADLFLSIHADAAPSRQAHGASIYCLSSGGAVSEAARLLAIKENLADMVGGSPNGESNDASGPIVLNMYQTNTINTSKIYGQRILENISQVIPLKFTTVQSAPFRVLKLPEIPSLLVETAYISNRNEEKLLRNRSYQNRIADAVVNAVVNFLPVEPVEQPPPAVQVATKESDTVQTDQGMIRPVSKTKKSVVGREAPSKPENIQSYRVKRGDTLARIAQQHGTTLSALLKLNRMKLRDPLFAGRVIKIKGRPEEKETATAVKKGDPEQTVKERFTYYRVRRGETLGLIAKRNGTSIDQLRQLNRMKPSDPLLADQRLKLPLQSSL